MFHIQPTGNISVRLLVEQIVPNVHTESFLTAWTETLSWYISREKVSLSF